MVPLGHKFGLRKRLLEKMNKPRKNPAGASCLEGLLSSTKRKPNSKNT